MQYRVTINDLFKGLLFELDVEPNTTVDVLKLKLSALQNVSYNKITLFYNGKELNDNKCTLQTLNINAGDIIIMDLKKTQRTNFNSISDEAAYLVEKSLIDSQFLDQLCNKDSELVEAILSENLQSVIAVLQKRKAQQPQQIQQPNRANNVSLNQQNLNPYDADYQKKIEEMITRERLDKLQHETYENYPELFVPTEMLYIHGRINGVDTEIFVDTGAQTTVISKKFAEKANILKNVDPRYAGIILGVGQTKSLGRIWQVPLQVEGRHFILSATVIEKFNHDILLGLDMMKRHRCAVDLNKNKLIFTLEGVETGFLKDNEVSFIQKRSMKEKIDIVKGALGVDEATAEKLLMKYGMDEEVTVESELNKG